MGSIIKTARVTPDDIKKINRYTRREFTQEQVYVFSVVLCDNEIDRDNERFTVEALFDMEKLFVGKTGILNHEPKAENQSARIFECSVENPPGSKTTFGDDYFRLVAKAYIPVCKNTEDLILLIDSGILKEVSVGCSVSEKICSVCGKDFDDCHHIKGKTYNNSRCCCLLGKPDDAYEWSFVAVPSQRQAGVIKGLKNYREIHMNNSKKTDFLKAVKERTPESVRLLSACGDILFSAEECSELSAELKKLLDEAQWGREYRENLCKSFVRLSGVVQPEISAGTARSICKRLSVDELRECVGAYEKKADRLLSYAPQLCSENEKSNADSKKNRAFEI